MKLRYIVATSIGGILEMYDFVIYLFLATYLAPLFFPQSDHRVSYLLTFAVFAIGYLARPIGGILIAHITDKQGRKKGLILAVAGTALASFLIGILPTYATLGLTAPILLTLFRLTQGLAVGGDFPSGIVFLAEHSQKDKRGLSCAWLYSGINLGVVLGSLIIGVLLFVLTKKEVLDFGWRIPFLIGGLLGLIGYYVRRKMEETGPFKKLHNDNAIRRVPFFTLMHQAKSSTLIGIGVICLMAVVIGVVMLSMPNYLHLHLGMRLDDAMKVNTISVLIFSCLIPVFGWLSDHWGRKSILTIATLLYFVLAYPLFNYIIKSDASGIWTALIIFDILSAMLIGPLPSALAEMFPTDLRTTGVATSYNISFGVFNGLTPFIMSLMIYMTDSTQAPAYFLMAAAVVTFIALLMMKRKVI